MRALLLLLPLLPLVAGCGDDLSTPKGIAEAEADAHTDLAKVLDSIKDEASAKAAKPEAEAIFKRLEEVTAAKMKVALAVGEKGMEDMQEAQKTVAAALQKRTEAREKLHDRIKNDPAAQAVVNDFVR
jgi:biotin synthase-like enzyme